MHFEAFDMDAKGKPFQSITRSSKYLWHRAASLHAERYGSIRSPEQVTEHDTKY